MRTPLLFLEVFTVALILPLLLLACGGSDEPAGGPSQERGSDAVSGSVDMDRDALVALYNATDGVNWLGKSDNWLSGALLGEWGSVNTNDDGRVIELNLGFNQLSGEMPTELGNLAKEERGRPVV